MLVEHGGHGGDVAAPVAVEIVDNYFAQVAPADKAAPHLGLPRRHGGIVTAVEDAGVGAGADEAAPARHAKPGAAAPAEAPPMKLDFTKPDDAPAAEEKPPAGETSR